MPTAKLPTNCKCQLPIVKINRNSEAAFFEGCLAVFANVQWKLKSIE